MQFCQSLKDEPNKIITITGWNNCSFGRFFYDCKWLVPRMVNSVLLYIVMDDIYEYGTSDGRYVVGCLPFLM
jgi:hypothetical protein